MARRTATLFLGAVLMTGALATTVSVIPTPADARGGRGGGGGGRGGGGGARAGGGGYSGGRSAPTSVNRGGGANRANVGGGANRANVSGGGANRVNAGNVNRGGGNRVNTGNVNNVNRSGNTYNRNVNVEGNGYHGGGYYGGGGYYHPVAAGVAIGATAAVTAAAIGSMYNTLPPSCSPYMGSYYYCGGVYYQPQYQGSDVTYVVVDKPG